MNPTNILFIEDEPDYQMLVSRILKEAGLVTQVADNGEEGMHLLMRNTPQLLLLDINLPDTNGYALCNRIRQEETWANLPIIMLTVRRQPKEWLEGLSSGADDYLAKPFNPSELIERIQARLAGKPERRLPDGKAEHLLIEAAVRGNRSAFEVLITQYKEPLRKSLSRHVKNALELDDLVSMTFVYGFERLKHFQGHANFFTWLHSIALNQLHKRWRSPSPVSLTDLSGSDDDSLVASGEESHADRISKETDNQRLHQALARVPSHYRAPLEMHYLQDLSYDDIARELAIPPGTVMSRLARGREYLRRVWDNIEQS
jgi:RNA polymerase sigma factor (sigma-70 family)